METAISHSRRLHLVCTGAIALLTAPFWIALLNEVCLWANPSGNPGRYFSDFFGGGPLRALLIMAVYSPLMFVCLLHEYLVLRQPFLAKRGSLAKRVLKPALAILALTALVSTAAMSLGFFSASRHQSFDVAVRTVTALPTVFLWLLPWFASSYFLRSVVLRMESRHARFLFFLLSTSVCALVVYAITPGFEGDHDGDHQTPIVIAAFAVLFPFASGTLADAILGPVHEKVESRPPMEDGNRETGIA